MKNKSKKIRITQIPYPQTKLCNFYQFDARSKRATLQKMYRNNYTTSQALPVLKLYVIKPRTWEKISKKYDQTWIYTQSNRTTTSITQKRRARERVT